MDQNRIPEGLGHKMALGAKIKKKLRKFFYDPLSHEVFQQVESPRKMLHLATLLPYFTINNLMNKQLNVIMKSVHVGGILENYIIVFHNPENLICNA